MPPALAPATPTNWRFRLVFFSVIPFPANPTFSGILNRTYGIFNRTFGILNRTSGILNRTFGILNRTSGILNRTSGITGTSSIYNNYTYILCFVCPFVLNKRHNSWIDRAQRNWTFATNSKFRIPNLCNLIVYIFIFQT